MTNWEKGIYNRGRTGGIADCIKRLAASGNGCLDVVITPMLEELCRASDDQLSIIDEMDEQISDMGIEIQSSAENWNKQAHAMGGEVF